MKSQLEIKTSFVSPVTLQIFIENSYLPVFIIRNIGNSSLIGKYSGTAVHMKNLAPSAELFRSKRDGHISLQEFEKRYIIEMADTNLAEVVRKLEYLAEISGARGIVLLGYGTQDKVCHRSILANLLNESGLLEKRVTELIL